MSRHTAFIAIKPESDRPYRGRCRHCPATASFETVDEAAGWCDEHDGKAQDREKWEAQQLRKAKAANN